jgi:hypothetical protein
MQSSSFSLFVSSDGTSWREENARKGKKEREREKEPVVIVNLNYTETRSLPLCDHFVVTL